MTHVRDKATEPNTAPRTVSPITIALLVALVTVVVFVPSTYNQFLLMDDSMVIYQNPHLLTPGYFWNHVYYFLYTPVTDTLYSLIATIFPLKAPIETPYGSTSTLSPAAFHGANVVFHALNAVLVFLLIRLLLPRPLTTRSDFSAAIGALTFAVHPLQVEPVAWVTGANNVFSGFFALLALIFYFQAAYMDSLPLREGVVGGSSHRAPFLIRFSLATLCFALALLSKPTVLVVPLAAVAIDVGILRRPLRKAAPLILWLAMSAAIAVVTHYAQPPIGAIAGDPLWFRPFLALNSIAFYLWKLIVPIPLCMDYGLDPKTVHLQTAWYAICLVPIALAALLWVRRAKWPLALAATAFSVCCLLPTLGFVPSYGAEVSVVADRYMYLAMIGPALIVADLLTRVRLRFAFPVCIAALVALAVLTVKQEPAWTDTPTLMSITLAVNPTSFAAHMFRAEWRSRHGDVDGSLDDSRAAVAESPNSFAALSLLTIRLCNAWIANGHPAGDVSLLLEAEPVARKAVAESPKNPDAYIDLGDIEYYLRHYADAAQQYESALNRNPADAQTKLKLGVCQQLLAGRQPANQ